MIEKTTKDLLVRLAHMCGLGTIIADIEPVTGGLMHRMYKVMTDSGVYAVKHLNPEIMKRPDVHENYARAEKIEAILENSGISIVPAIVTGGKKNAEDRRPVFLCISMAAGKNCRLEPYFR